jgi:hypothetical protein
MDILQIREFCEHRKIEWTSHAAKRLLQRGISSSDVATAIATGDIIENYPEDYPFPSCLIVGKTTKGKVLHIVCSIGDEKLWIITAYEPNLIDWDLEFRVRKEQK